MIKFLKIIVFYFSIILLLLSCSNDGNENHSASVEEEIIGTWKLVDRSPNGIEYCEMENILELSEGGSFFGSFYIGDNVDECESATVTGNWSVMENDQLEIIFNGGEVITVVLDVNFSQNLNRLELSNNYGNETTTEIYVRL